MDYGFKLDPGEKILRVIHRHIFDLLPSLVMALVLSMAAAGLAYIAARYPETVPFPAAATLLLVTLLTIIAGVILFVGVYMYLHNLLIFTNTHLVKVEQISLFQRQVSQLSFLRVEDVTGRKIGLLQTLFDYGEIEIQTAGAENKFVFKNVPSPEVLADQALEIHEVCLREHPSKRTEV
jgi:hypothetical protein